MKQGKELIESSKLARIEINLLRLKKVLNAVFGAHYSLNDRLNALNNIYSVVSGLVGDTNKVCTEINPDLLEKDDRIKFLSLIADVEFAVEAYEKALEETKGLIDLPNIGKKPPKKAGRPKASTNKHLKDFLKGCDSCSVTQAVTNCSYKDKPGFFGQLLIALLDLRYIEISDIGKELYEAIRNDFPEAPSIDSIRKICPQNEWVINKNKSRYKYKIEEIKRLL